MIITRARATVVSLGGIVLLALIFPLLALVFGSNHLGLQIFGGTLIVILCFYAVHVVTEELVLTDAELIYRSRVRMDQRYPLSQLDSIRIVHEGLNDEEGIIRLHLHYPNVQQVIILGPCWRRYELEQFFLTLEVEIGKHKLVEHVR